MKRLKIREIKEYKKSAIKSKLTQKFKVNLKKSRLITNKFKFYLL
jgi:hypothetical protein